MPPRPGQPPPGPQPLPGVDAIVAVGSGKGGVGKTTLAVNLALALAKLGHKTGLLDAVVYVPNVPLMLGTSAQPRVLGENRIEPLEVHGLKVISVGLLNPGDKPLIWRGPMLHSIIRQFLGSVEWGTLDYLIVDLPPGTGDVALSLIQTVPLTGAIVVSTPSDVSLQDARKAIEMFPNFFLPHVALGQALFQKGDYSTGIEELEKAKAMEPTPFLLGALGYAYAKSGRKDEARKLLVDLKEQSKRRYVASYWIEITFSGALALFCFTLATTFRANSYRGLA